MTCRSSPSATTSSRLSPAASDPSTSSIAACNAPPMSPRRAASIQRAAALRASRRPKALAPRVVSSAGLFDAARSAMVAGSKADGALAAAGAAVVGGAAGARLTAASCASAPSSRAAGDGCRRVTHDTTLAHIRRSKGRRRELQRSDRRKVAVWNCAALIARRRSACHRLWNQTASCVIKVERRLIRAPSLTALPM